MRLAAAQKQSNELGVCLQPGNAACFAYPPRVLSTSLALALLVSFASASIPAVGQTTPNAFAPKRVKTYPLHNWKNISCRAKGRFQDRGYCDSAVIDQIVADGKSAIPILISQITDSRWISEPVYDFWPRIRTGELAYFILENLFVDDTWQKKTMPALFPPQDCGRDEPSWVCWGKFRETHTLKELQNRWMDFWNTNKDRIYWDAKARCARLSDPKIESGKR